MQVNGRACKMEKMEKGGNTESFSAKKEEPRSAICCYEGCKEAVMISPRNAKYCKKHRQALYKVKYRKRNYKNIDGYRASRACFFGSVDSFIGQDLDDTIHQVLVRKRLELMRSPALVSFLHQHQQEVKNATQAKSRRHQSFISQCEERRVELGSSLFSTIPEKKTDSNASTPIDSDTTENSSQELSQAHFFDTKLHDTIRLRNSPRQVNIGHCTSVRENESNKPMELNNNLESDASQPILLRNNVFGNSVDRGRKSAFQETGAGDAKSLLAVRSVAKDPM